jgi:hypothetical protein
VNVQINDTDGSKYSQLIHKLVSGKGIWAHYGSP